jgi:hypothetical protein
VFAYQASDGSGTTSGELTVTISGTNDRPFLWPPIADRTIASGAQNSWSVAGSFRDMDRNDVLSYSARLVGGGALPDWLSFDPATGTFSGSAPAGGRGSLDIMVTATDGHGPDSAVSDVFRLSYGRKNNREGDFGEAWTQMSLRLDAHLQDRGGLLGGEAGGDMSCASVWDGDTFAMLSAPTMPAGFRPPQGAREMLARLG